MHQESSKFRGVQCNAILFGNLLQKVRDLATVSSPWIIGETLDDLEFHSKLFNLAGVAASTHFMFHDNRSS